MNKDHSFAIRRVLAWTTVLAPLAAFVGALPLVTPAVVASHVVVSFIVIDWRTKRANRLRGCLAVSYFTLSLGLAMASWVLTIMLMPAHLAFKQSLMATLQAVSSGSWIEDGVVLIVVLTFAVFVGFATLAAVSFITALWEWKTRDAAKWLAVANVPGLLLTAYVAFAVLQAGFSGQ